MDSCCFSRVKEPKSYGPKPKTEDAAFEVPHYQRVSTTGEDCTGVPIEDLKSAAEMLVKAIEVRQRHMKIAQQQYPSLGNSVLAAYKGEVYEKPKIPKRATLEGEAKCHYYLLSIEERKRNPFLSKPFYRIRRRYKNPKHLRQLLCFASFFMTYILHTNIILCVCSPFVL